MILSLAALPDELLARVKQKTGEDIIVCDYQTDRQAAMRQLPLAEILITWGAPINQGLFQGSTPYPSLKWLFSLSVGLENLPFESLIQKNILVSHIKGVLNSSIAEQTLGIMIAFNRRLKQCILNQQKEYWETPFPVEELSGKTVCIIGTGSIGCEIARKAAVFHMRPSVFPGTPMRLPYGIRYFLLRNCTKRWRSLIM